jgi:hypothetical protein
VTLLTQGLPSSNFAPQFSSSSAAFTIATSLWALLNGGMAEGFDGPFADAANRDAHISVAELSNPSPLIQKKAPAQEGREGSRSAMLREAASEEAPRLGRENLFRGKPFNQKFETLGFLGVTPKTVKQTFDVAQSSRPIRSFEYPPFPPVSVNIAIHDAESSRSSSRTEEVRICGRMRHNICQNFSRKMHDRFSPTGSEQNSGIEMNRAGSETIDVVIERREAIA